MKILEKLLNILVNLAKIIGNLQPIQQLIFVGLLIFSAFFLGKCDTPTIDNVKVEVEQHKKIAEQLNDSISKLTNEVGEKEEYITKLTIQISARQQTRQKLVERQVVYEERKRTETDTVKLVALQDTIIDNLKVQVASADTVIAQKDTIIAQKEGQVNLLKNALTLEKVRSTEFETALNKTLSAYKTETKIFGFIPKPTRKAAFIVGVTAGVITGIVITK